MLIPRLLTFGFALLFGASALLARDYYLTPEGAGARDGASWENPSGRSYGGEFTLPSHSRPVETKRRLAFSRDAGWHFVTASCALPSLLAAVVHLASSH